MVQRVVPLFEPPVDDLTLPGEIPFERIDGDLIHVAPAEEPHGLSHSTLAALLSAHVTSDYQVALDMLTRVTADSEVAPDACIYAVEREVTGGRKLEELAFEILDSERRKHAARKAQLLVARGVRRVFAIDLRWSQVLEWDRALGDWRLLVPGSVIDDPCFVRALATNALRGIGVKDEVVAGWVSQGHPALRREVEREARVEVERAQLEAERARTEAERTRTEAGRARTEAQLEAERARVEALRATLEDLCEAYGVELTEARHAQLRAMDLAALEALRAHLKQHRAWPAL